MDIRFTATGLPKPAGSKTGFSNPETGKTRIVDACKKTKLWQGVVAAAARDAYDGPLLRGPVGMHVMYFFPRPQWHYGTGRNASKLKASAPTEKTTRPDLGKLDRAIEDALTGVIWQDDALVVQRISRKCYGDSARAEVWIWERGAK